MEAVKAETYIKGSVDKASQENASEFVFNETAGDERVHERKIERNIITSIAMLKSLLSSYLYSDVESEGQDGDVYFIINVSDRFKKALIDPIAKLCMKFIEDYCLLLWWGTIGNMDKVQYHKMLSDTSLSEIKQNLSQKTFGSLSSPYPRSLTCLGSRFTIEVGETAEVSYVIDSGAVDDIECCPANNAIESCKGNGRFLIRGRREGLCSAVIYSVHDELNVFKRITIEVLPSSRDDSFPHLNPQ